MLKKVLKILEENNPAAILIFIGSCLWSATMVKSGLIYKFGMGFWGPNGHDGVWHIALAESLSRGSLEMPTFAGEGLKNYHLGFDLILAVLHKLTTISVSTLYFQVIPPILAILIGILTYKLIIVWKNSKTMALWAVFFVYFGGSLGWIFSLLRGQGLLGESMFWAQQGISTLINPPFALSLVFILSGLISLFLFLQSHSKIHILSSIIFFGILIQIKAYAGMLVIGGLFIAGVFEYFRFKKSDILKIFAGTLGLSLILFLPLIKSSQGLIVFKPFWFLEAMMGSADRFGWQRFYSAMINWRSGGIWIKAIPAYITAFVIFWVGNMGTRLVKEIMVWKWIRKTRDVGWMEVFVVSIIVVGVLIPMIFLQSGTAWNTIQFFYYSLFFSSILAGVALGEVIQSSKLDLKLIRIVVLAIDLVTIPTTIGTLTQYLPSRPPAKISNEELAGLTFLRAQPEGVVLTNLFDREKAEEAKSSPPRPLYLYESSAYVSAFSGKPVYFEDEVNLDITGYLWRERRKEVEGFFASSDESLTRKFLKENEIRYLYLLRGQRAALGEGQLGLEKIYENQEIEIYRVQKS